MESIEQLAGKAGALQPVDRIRLVEAILLSLDKVDPEIHERWVRESEARYVAYQEGRLDSADWEEVRKRHNP